MQQAKTPKARRVDGRADDTKTTSTVGSLRQELRSKKRTSKKRAEGSGQQRLAMTAGQKGRGMDTSLQSAPTSIFLRGLKGTAHVVCKRANECARYN